MNSPLQQDVERRERSLIENMFVGLFVFFMMAVFIMFFFMHDEGIEDKGLASLAKSFTVHVNNVKAQWLIDSKTDVVFYQLYDMNTDSKETRKVRVNKKGWPDNQEQHFACRIIWMELMAQPLEVLNKQISAIEVVKKDFGEGRLCQFGIDSRVYFEYNSANGVVSDIKQYEES
ncbi:hypothetical protein [Thalassotalea agarivorans]|uniref:Uncharacterized protein n=1 Tax=Thalassotalea agarivorans TaxID=349064 RepID=A0A1I0G279_THASX|nr:hypothetical protein [Thalassotalea agarivorans]SET64099.1 hypothetical protein SAMN05660429_02302 [Thalassotalea agarivorans]